MWSCRCACAHALGVRGKEVVKVVVFINMKSEETGGAHARTHTRSSDTVVGYTGRVHQQIVGGTSCSL